MWTTRLEPEAEVDLALIYEHLVEAQLAFGASEADVRARAPEPVLSLDAALDRIEASPFRGQQHGDLGAGVRHLTIDRLLVWFQIVEDAEEIRVLGFFYGAADHIRRMVARLLARNHRPAIDCASRISVTASAR